MASASISLESSTSMDVPAVFGVFINKNEYWKLRSTINPPSQFNHPTSSGDTRQ